MRILFFGKLGDTIGREVQVEIPGESCTVGELRHLLGLLHPRAQPDLAKPTLRACVADTIVDEQFRLSNAAEVEFFPPLSGG